MPIMDNRLRVSVQYSELSFCTLIYFSRSCLESTSYSAKLSVGAIVGIVIGGLALLLFVIWKNIIRSKRKPAQVWTVQRQQQQMGLKGFINRSRQQQPSGFYHHQPVGLINTINPQTLSMYSWFQPAKMQA
jgi:hypothetical protein